MEGRERERERECVCVCVSVTNLVEQAHTIADHDRRKPYGERETGERREGWRERERGREGVGREEREREGGEREGREGERERENVCVCVGDQSGGAGTHHC